MKYLLTVFAPCMALLAFSMLTCGCAENPCPTLPGKWALQDAQAHQSGAFMAHLTFGAPGKSGTGAFHYEEYLLLPENENGEHVWIQSCYVLGAYRVEARSQREIHPWADAEMVVAVDEYVAELLQSFNAQTGRYTYEQVVVSGEEETPLRSRALLTVNVFDELVIAWGTVSGEPFVSPVESADKSFPVNTGLYGDTYVRVE